MTVVRVKPRHAQPSRSSNIFSIWLWVNLLTGKIRGSLGWKEMHQSSRAHSWLPRNYSNYWNSYAAHFAPVKKSKEMSHEALELLNIGGCDLIVVSISLFPIVGLMSKDARRGVMRIVWSFCLHCQSHLKQPAHASVINRNPVRTIKRKRDPFHYIIKDK